MKRILLLGVLAVSLSACASGPRASLEDVKPTRTYNAEVPVIMDAIRLYCLQEAFKVDRMDAETGTVIGHKVFGASGMRDDYTGSGTGNRTVIMHLKAIKGGPGKTDLTASFSLGGGQVAATRNDENMLIEHYNGFFRYMEENVVQHQ